MPLALALTVPISDTVVQVTSFVQGFMVPSTVMLYVLHMRKHYHMSAQSTAAVLTCLPFVLYLQNRISTAATVKYGLNAV